jgi:hypothetical protein
MAELRTNGNNVYELGWLGEDGPFLEGLQLAGVQVSRMPAQGKAIVTTPTNWTTGRFFEVARARGVVLTQMKPEEEDLQRVFLRVTEEEKAAASPETAHGHR